MLLVIVQDSLDTTPSPTTVRSLGYADYRSYRNCLGRYSITASTIMSIFTIVVLNKFYGRVKEVMADADETVNALVPQ